MINNNNSNNNNKKKKIFARTHPQNTKTPESSR